MKPGYIYVLLHPSNPDLYKIGITTRKPEERLAEHNNKYTGYAGKIVKDTGLKWILKDYLAVPDTIWAENVFWGATPLADIPFRGGAEVYKMEWEWVQAGMNAVKNSGLRPPPEPLPDYVNTYTLWMNKRLKGREITLVGNVTSRSGKSTFRCSNGHEWRTKSSSVGEGEGCPQCGIGRRTKEEIWQAAKLGYLCLLTHPKQPGVIKIGLTYLNFEQWQEGNIWEDWEVHRYRFVEDPVLAEKLIWKLLGQPLPHNREPIKIDLAVAEQAFRGLS